MQEQRSEARVAHQIRFFVHVHRCPDEPNLVGTSMACEAVDFSPHGLQLRTDGSLAPGSVINITIAIGEGFAMYLLRGEVRWQRKVGGEQRMGILLQEADDTDYDKWVNAFRSIFENDDPG